MGICTYTPSVLNVLYLMIFTTISSHKSKDTRRLYFRSNIARIRVAASECCIWLLHGLLTLQECQDEAQWHSKYSRDWELLETHCSTASPLPLHTNQQFWIELIMSCFSHLTAKPCANLHWQKVRTCFQLNRSMKVHLLKSTILSFCNVFTVFCNY